MTAGTIDQIGSAPSPAASAPARRVAWPTALPGVRRFEWHEAATPDGEYVRLPVPGLVLILNVATRGEWRRDGGEPWRPQPAASVRGLALRPSQGRDPATGALGYVSVVLAPWAAPLYLGPPASAFVHDVTDLALVARGWPSVLERVACAESPRGRCALVEAALRARVRGLDPGSEAALRATCATAARLERGEPVAAVAASLGITPRRLHQRALATFGVAPGALARLARFGRGVEALQPDADARALADWRAEHADQSHATRAFRRLAGLTPGRYAALQRGAARVRFCAPVSAPT